jgi:hypothetical protein
VAKSVSVHFGGGRLTNSEGQQDEQSIFGRQARWMDYSGPVAWGQGSDRRTVTEGITYFDHPANPRHPAYWHVREDGWMGASFCMQQPYEIAAERPLILRYFLHAHTAAYDRDRAERVHGQFARRSGFQLIRSDQKHLQYEVRRETGG